LARRILQFKQRWPGSRLSYNSLWNIYHQAGVTWKSMRTSYRFSEAKLEEIRGKRVKAFTSVIGASDSGRKILYADEVSFNAYGVRMRSWAGLGENQTLSKGNLKLPPLYVLVVSAEVGLEAYSLSSRPIRGPDAIELIQSMGARQRSGTTTLFWDNLPMHRNREVVQSVEDQGWLPLYNAPYSGPWHCIEVAFASVKRHWRRGLMERDFDLS
jgi:hypothetical protein